MPSILIVDDSVFLRSRIKDALKSEGYAIREAGNGSLALAALAEQNFECVLTDLLMPELDGFGLLEGIRERGISVPVVVLSADIQQTTRSRCEELGARAIVPKPVNPQQLRSVIAEAIAGRPA